MGGAGCCSSSAFCRAHAAPGPAESTAAPALEHQSPHLYSSARDLPGPEERMAPGPEDIAPGPDERMAPGPEEMTPGPDDMTALPGPDDIIPGPDEYVTPGPDE